MLTRAAVAAQLLLSLTAASPIATPSSVFATPHPAPTSGSYNWAEGWTSRYPIHQSCNVTLRAQLEEALDETVQLAQHARDHLLRWGSNSEFAVKYFGNHSTAALGWYDRIVAADKTGMTFRCDDPDRNCATQDNWAGHWRGDNATEETVICPRSFEIRRHLSSVCGLGYTVAESPLNTFWATDLMHRLLHVPTISQGIVDHFAEDYAEVVELAQSGDGNSAIDSDAIQYFAIDVWAYDIAAPGVGCSGETPEAVAEEATTTASAAASTTETAAAATSTTGQDCHTHADGTVHCV
ncbi:hypothetical protein S40293_05587 [Stachybotrys chartarum IBT 40293]|nr:hypothetical protein S40293_05587 [Stachybotrys chartarum IBT 40293]